MTSQFQFKTTALPAKLGLVPTFDRLYLQHLEESIYSNLYTSANPILCLLVEYHAGIYDYVLQIFTQTQAAQIYLVVAAAEFRDHETGLVSRPFSWFQSRQIFLETHETETNPIFWIFVIPKQFQNLICMSLITMTNLSVY